MMKKLFVLMLSALLLTGCSRKKTPTPVDPISGTTTSGNTTTLTQENDENDKVMIVMKQRASYLNVDAKQIEKASFSWFDKNFTRSKLNGYRVEKRDATYNAWNELFTTFQEKNWEGEMQNSADGPGAGQVGFSKDGVVCLIGHKTDADPEELRSEKNNINDFGVTLTISCAQGPAKIDNNEQTLAMQGGGFEPMRSFTLKDGVFLFNNPENPEGSDYIIDHFEERDGIYFFEGESISGRITSEKFLNPKGDFDSYTIYLTLGADEEYQGGADMIPEGGEVYIYERIDELGGESGSLQTLKEKTGFEDPDMTDGEYLVQDTYHSYVLMGITSPEGRGYSIILKYTPEGWKQIRAGQDIDEESCKALQEQDPEILNWSFLHTCFEELARG